MKAKVTCPGCGDERKPRAYLYRDCWWPLQQGVPLDEIEVAL